VRMTAPPPDRGAFCFRGFGPEPEEGDRDFFMPFDEDGEICRDIFLYLDLHFSYCVAPLAGREQQNRE